MFSFQLMRKYKIQYQKSTVFFFSQETYLNATLAFLAKVIETGRFMELIENRKETKDIGRFVTSEMSTILNKVALESVYARAREIFKQQQRGSYAQVSIKSLSLPFIHIANSIRLIYCIDAILRLSNKIY